ncbi:kinase-like protein, partial [Ramicandelaber brevisporus]
MASPLSLEISSAVTATAYANNNDKHMAAASSASSSSAASAGSPATPVLSNSSFLVDAPHVAHRPRGYIASVYGAPLKVLGQGTGGIVHLHRIPSTGQHVAVKTFTFPADISLTRRMRHIESEASVSLAMQHPNVIRTYEFVFETSDKTEQDGTFYSTMEYCPSDLFEHVQSKALTMRVVESLFIQLVAGVQYLHRVHGMAHRDLKLDNIVIAADGTLKIIDFGCSRVVPVDSHGFAMTSGMCGSDPYLPPEVLANPNMPYDAMRLDVWSIATVFLAMVSGNFPWEV